MNSLEELRDGSRQEIREPPHADEIEAQLKDKLDGLVDEIDQRVKATLDTLYAELNSLTKACELSSKRAKAALGAHLATATAVDDQAAKVKQTLGELRDGHINLAKITTNGNGNGQNHR